MSLTFHAPESLITRRLRIAVIGAGGTGSEMLDGLARLELAICALGHPGFDVTVYDGDTVSSTNILRQRFLPGDEGVNKAEVLVHRYNMFFGVNWTAVPRNLNAKAIPARFNPDLLITCVDKAAVRSQLAAAYRRQYLPTLWLDTGNDSHQGQVILGHLGRVNAGLLRLPNVLDLYPEIEMHAADLDNDGPSCSAEESLSRQELPVNRAVALAGYSLLWNLLRHGCLNHHGTFIDIRAGRTSPLMIDPDAWAMMGYAAA